MKKFIRLLFFLLVSVSVSGQLTPVTNQYILNPLIINSAFAGNRGALNISALYKRQWVGINGAPETMIFAMDIPLHDSKLGLGMILTHDKVGVTTETQFSSCYSYKIKMGEANLSFGLGAGLITTNTAWSDLVVLDPGDEPYLVDSRVFCVPDFSFGSYYTCKNYFAGFSIPRLLSYQFNYDKNRYTLKVNPDQYYYLFNMGWVFNLTSKMKFLPSTLVTFSPDKKILYDINAHFSFNDRLWAGISYRNNRSFAGLLQFAVNNRFKVAWIYDFDIGTLGRYTNGSHEIMLKYEFKYKGDSVRPQIF
jgi:type IX secretion system PorP/SprF family membrane protein